MNDQVHGKQTDPHLEAHGKLIRSGLQVLVAWQCTDRTQRRPRTLAKLARMLGIQVSTLSQIKKLPEFHEELVKRVRTKFRDHVPEMVPVLFARAQAGSIRAKRLIEKIRGRQEQE